MYVLCDQFICFSPLHCIFNYYLYYDYFCQIQCDASLLECKSKEQTDI